MIRAFLAMTWALSALGQFGIVNTQYDTSPPVYPSPNATGTGDWAAAHTKAKSFLEELTLEEKASMVTGTPGPCVGNIAPIHRLNFSGLCLLDGPLSVRTAIYASVFPAELSVAASWDRALAHQRGLYMGTEFRLKGAHIGLAPVVGALGRSPYGGRNWEGFSPDAYLSGELVGESVKGIQAAGLQATTKHLIANEQETQRSLTTVNGTIVEALSSNVDDKTIHETYLWPFANAVRAGSASIMCSYNRINGSYGCQNSKVLNGLLKGELGFQGYVMSDWGATHAGVAAIEAGLDMDMPGTISSPGSSFFGGNVTTAVNNGTLAVQRLDDMILRIMTPYYHLNQDTNVPPVDGSSGDFGVNPPSTWVSNFTLGPIVDVRTAATNSLIRTLGAAGTVLLKNTNNALPLKKPMNVGVFGSDAADFTTGMYAAGPDNAEMGTLAVGGGSGSGRFSYVVSPLDAIKSRAQSYGALVQYVTNNSAIAAGGLVGLKPLPLDVCIVFLKAWAAEGFDRSSLLQNWNSSAVVSGAASVCNNTVVVMHGASANVIPFASNPNVTAILAAHMPGQESGNAIADILWGDMNPAGKLPYTITASESDWPMNLANSSKAPGPNGWQEDFTEGNLIDYKAFDAANKSALYEFGFGLSYTTFSLSNMSTTIGVANASRFPSPTAPIQPGGNAELWTTLASVRATVTNTGIVRGATVAQLYLQFSGQKERVLRGFEKTELRPGESMEVVFPLMRRDLSVWDVVAQEWRLVDGNIGVKVGFSSRDVKEEGVLRVCLDACSQHS